ncbi:alpha-hydroxy acid oxidase [Xanthobacter sp. KR7-225]|uniref:alpha-hydroxy acid oxidase n=1 Tax=Xanthobacter sp. KR7-225 TaxID=3156613 RepID=UPI0032B3E388
MASPDRPRTVAELFQRAQAALDAPVWDYLTGGAESETSLCRNRLALDGHAFVPRVLRDVSRIDAGADFLGAPIALPAFLAPVGSLRLFDPAAATACARAAAAARVPMVMSIMAQPTLEEVRAGAPDAILVLQLYMRGGRDWLAATVARAEAARCAALCLTVDAAVYGRRERDLINRYSSAAAVDRANLGDRKDEQIAAEQAQLSWDTIAWLKARTRLPLIVKGVLSAEDARLCVEHGVDVVYASNHGGRQLDHAVAALDQLGEIAAAIAGRARLFVDGGVLRGTDIAKARALGADLVGLGKAQGAALAAGGEAGVVRLIEILGEELRTALALLGCTGLGQLGPHLLRQVTPVGPPTALSTLRLAPAPAWPTPCTPEESRKTPA